MIIIKLYGGLANQMFQLAFYKKFLNMGKNIKLDNFFLDDYLQDRNWESALNIFNFTASLASYQECCQLGDIEQGIMQKIRRKFIGWKDTHIFENESGDFEEKIFTVDNAYLEGYWQSYKYFSDINEEILRCFTFPKLHSTKCLEFENKINSFDHSASIHIRMGDYLSEKNKKIYGNICTKSYYSKAIEYFDNKYQNMHFFVFSNDKEFINKYLDRKKFTIIDCNDEKMAWADMYLMTKCKYNIIANSSFSWWGAWLNQHKDKEVIAPKKWINTKEMKNICPPEWIRL